MSDVLDVPGGKCIIERDGTTFILRIVTKKMIKLAEVGLVSQVLRDFLQLLPPRGGAIVIDCTETEMFTLQQLASIAGELREQNHVIKERLIGTIMFVSRSTYVNTIIARFFKSVYKPVRPYEIVDCNIDIKAKIEEMRQVP